MGRSIASVTASFAGLPVNVKVHSTVQEKVSENQTCHVICGKKVSMRTWCEHCQDFVELGGTYTGNSLGARVPKVQLEPKLEFTGFCPLSEITMPTISRCYALEAQKGAEGLLDRLASWMLEREVAGVGTWVWRNCQYDVRAIPFRNSAGLGLWLATLHEPGLVKKLELAKPRGHDAVAEMLIEKVLG